MTRYQLLCAVTRISEILDTCGLKGVLKQTIQAEGKSDQARANPMIIETYQAFTSYSRQFGKAERRVLKALKLGFLQHTDFWVQFLQGKLGRDAVRNVLERIYVAQKYLPGLTGLLQSEAEMQIEKPNADRSEVFRDLEILTVIFSRQSNALPPVRQVQELLTAVDAFYEACAMLIGTGTELSFLGLDSGEDTRVQFVGAQEPVTLIKNSILAVWDRRALLAENEAGFCTSEQVDDLPVFSLLNEKSSKGAISESRSEQIHAMLCEAFELFLNADAVIPEVEDIVADEDPDLLMNLRQVEKPLAKPKVVVLHPDTAAETSDEAPTGLLVSDDAWDKERDMLLKLVEERRA